MKHETSVKNHKTSSKEYSPNDSTLIASDYPLCRVVCKLEGNQENRKSLLKEAFVSIENDKTLKIEKCDEVDGKTVKNQWIFRLNQFYGHRETIEKVYEKEFIETEYFSDFFNGFKSNIILVTNNTNSIMKMEDNVFKVCQSSLDEIFKVKEKLPQTYGGKKFVTLSIFEINNDKLSELIDFNTNASTHNQKELKIFDHIEETYIDGLVEIKINKPSDFTDIIKLICYKNSSKKSNQKTSTKIQSSQFKHQIVTIKSYITTRNFQYDEKYLDFKNPDLFKVTSKLNIIIYKAHEIAPSIKSTTDRNYTINSSENYKFFNSLKNIQKIAQSFLKTNQIKNTLCSQFRSCKILRVIKDTFLFNQKNVILSLLPINVEYVILLHDILNSIKPRKMYIDVCDNSTISNNEVSFFCENKENISLCANKQSLGCNLQNNLELNFEKLQINEKNSSAKKENKPPEEFSLIKKGHRNLWLLFSKFEENLGNYELAYEYSQKGLLFK